MWNKIIAALQPYPNILLFRHEFPDMDAIGSQLGMKFLLEQIFPEKQIYVLGEMSGLAAQFIDHSDSITDDELAKSAAVVLDTSNAARVDDQRFLKAPFKIQIDHHIHQEKFCDLEWIDEKACATCEILADACRKAQVSLPKVSAELFYDGLIADSIRFTIKTVRPQSLMAGAYLLEQGADIMACEQINFTGSYADYRYEAQVRIHSHRREKMLYAIMEPDVYQSCEQTFSSAKEKVYALSGVRGITVWALFTRMEDGVHYSASLRSKLIPIRDIAVQYHGGGHDCASGIKNLTREEVDEIVNLLEKRSLQ